MKALFEMGRDRVRACLSTKKEVNTKAIGRRIKWKEKAPYIIRMA